MVEEAVNRRDSGQPSKLIPDTLSIRNMLNNLATQKKLNSVKLTSQKFASQTIEREQSHRSQAVGGKESSQVGLNLSISKKEYVSFIKDLSSSLSANKATLVRCSPAPVRPGKRTRDR